MHLPTDALDFRFEESRWFKFFLINEIFASPRNLPIGRSCLIEIFEMSVVIDFNIYLGITTSHKIYLSDTNILSC